MYLILTAPTQYKDRSIVSVCEGTDEFKTLISITLLLV